MSIPSTGKVSSVAEIAEIEEIDNSYISRMMSLNTLAPDIIEKILDDELPENIRIYDLAKNTPLLWDDQRARLMELPRR